MRSSVLSVFSFSFDYRKRVVKKVELAQNLARENLQRAQQKMKDYYDQKTKEPVI